MKIEIKIFFTFLIGIWIAGIFYGFFADSFPSLLPFFPLVKKSYSLVCHQNPVKTFEFFDFHLLLCARCTGIYLGAFFSSMLFLFLKRISIKNRILIFAALPMFFDIAAYNLNFYSYSKIFAFLTGVLLGSVGFLYISGALIELFDFKKKEIFE